MTPKGKVEAQKLRIHEEFIRQKTSWSRGAEATAETRGGGEATAENTGGHRGQAGTADPGPAGTDRRGREEEAGLSAGAATGKA